MPGYSMDMNLTSAFSSTLAIDTYTKTTIDKNWEREGLRLSDYESANF
jgi:hypothetical protein